MLLHEIMTLQPTTIGPEASVLEAAQRLQEARVGCLLVVKDDVLEGVLTDRDIVVRCLASGHNAGSCRVSSHMTQPVVTAPHTMDVLEAAHLMTEHSIKRVPITEHGRLVGVVSSSDVAAAIDRPVHDLLVGMRKPRRVSPP